MTELSESPAERLAALDTQTREQRALVKDLARLAQERLRPARIAQDAGNRALDVGLDSIDRAKTFVRTNPAKTAAAVLAVTAFITRRPLLKFACKSYTGLRAKWDARTMGD